MPANDENIQPIQNIEIISSEKNKPLLVFENYIYRINRTNIQKNEVIWRCTARNCRSSIVTNDQFSEIIRQGQPHNHQMNPEQITKRKIESRIRSGAMNIGQNPRSIIALSLETSNPAVSMIMPSYDSMQRNIQNMRQRSTIHHSLPASAEVFVIPAEFTTTKNGSRFLLHDDQALLGQRIIMFATDEALNILSQTTSIFFDGTFSVVPSIFYQLFVIHGDINGHVLPLAYVLMQRKTRESYLIVWRKIQEYTTNSIRNAMSDFEIASMQAFHEIFPNVVLTGCYYHFCQSIWRAIQRFGLVSAYNGDQNLRINLRMLSALAFCTVHLVSQYYDLLEDQITAALPNNESLRQLLDYFEENYIGRFRRNGRDNPRFSLSVWNQKSRVLDHLPRTNNHVEGWHRAFSSMVDADHPNIFTFLTHLKNEESLISSRIIRAISINPREPRRRRLRVIEAQLNAIVARFDTMAPLTFLEAIANIYSF